MKINEQDIWFKELDQRIQQLLNVLDFEVTAKALKIKHIRNFLDWVKQNKVFGDFIEEAWKKSTYYAQEDAMFWDLEITPKVHELRNDFNNVARISKYKKLTLYEAIQERYQGDPFDVKELFSLLKEFSKDLDLSIESNFILDIKVKTLKNKIETFVSKSRELSDYDVIKAIATLENISHPTEKYLRQYYPQENSLEDAIFENYFVSYLESTHLKEVVGTMEIPKEELYSVLFTLRNYFWDCFYIGSENITPYEKAFEITNHKFRASWKNNTLEIDNIGKVSFTPSRSPNIQNKRIPYLNGIVLEKICNSKEGYITVEHFNKAKGSSTVHLANTVTSINKQFEKAFKKGQLIYPVFISNINGQYTLRIKA